MAACVSAWYFWRVPELLPAESIYWMPRSVVLVWISRRCRHAQIVLVTPLSPLSLVPLTLAHSPLPQPRTAERQAVEAVLVQPV